MLIVLIYERNPIGCSASDAPIPPAGSDCGRYKPSAATKRNAAERGRSSPAILGALRMDRPMADTILLEREGSRATLTLNRPQVHNAFDDALIADLTAALESLATDSAVRAVVVTGAGATFSAGADLNWMRGMA